MQPIDRRADAHPATHINQFKNEAKARMALRVSSVLQATRVQKQARDKAKDMASARLLFSSLKSQGEGEQQQNSAEI